jgi:CheY-like chemotaxis protein
MPLDTRKMMIGNLGGSSTMLRKSNLGAMIKVQFEKGKKDQKAKVLLIADTAGTHDIILHLLTIQDLVLSLEKYYDVSHTTNETEVLKILSMVAFSTSTKQASVDLIVLDYEMRSLNAFDLFLKIRQKYFPNELPIMFVCSEKAKLSEERVHTINDLL